MRRLCFQGQILDKYMLQESEDEGYNCLDYKNMQGSLSGMNELLKRETQIASLGYLSKVMYKVFAIESPEQSLF